MSVTSKGNSFPCFLYSNALLCAGESNCITSPLKYTMSPMFSSFTISSVRGRVKCFSMIIPPLINTLLCHHYRALLFFFLSTSIQLLWIQEEYMYLYFHIQYLQLVKW